MRRLTVWAAALAAAAFALCLASISTSWGEPSAPAGSGVFGLARPAFAQTGGQALVEQEAGITAYVKLSSVDLNAVKGKCRTIEVDEPGWLICSVPLPDYSSSHDIHVYLTADGWVVGYYTKYEPTCKIVDWVHYVTDSDTLPNKLALGIQELVLGISPAQLSYYHFGYPTANRMQLTAANNTFYITIPTGITLLSACYSAERSDTCLGTIPPATLSYDDRHSVEGYYMKIDGVPLNYNCLGDASRPFGLGLIYIEP